MAWATDRLPRAIPSKATEAPKDMDNPLRATVTLEAPLDSHRDPPDTARNLGAGLYLCRSRRSLTSRSKPV